MEYSHRPSLGPSDGEIGGWAVVSASQYSVTSASMCVCGDEDCCWTVTAYFVTTGATSSPLTNSQGHPLTPRDPQKAR